ncbi:MAG: hypothetical protein AVDCRST_MAG49-1308, partial [uncultured Thermomicrobiales bacterium]
GAGGTPSASRLVDGASGRYGAGSGGASSGSVVGRPLHL